MSFWPRSTALNTGVKQIRCVELSSTGPRPRAPSRPTQQFLRVLRAPRAHTAPLDDEDPGPAVYLLKRVPRVRISPGAQDMTRHNTSPSHRLVRCSELGPAATIYRATHLSTDMAPRGVTVPVQGSLRGADACCDLGSLGQPWSGTGNTAAPTARLSRGADRRNLHVHGSR